MLKNFPTEVHCGQHVWCQNLISLYRAALRLPRSAPVEFFGRRIWHPTSSHFLRRNCRPQGRSSLRSSHSDVCRHVYAISFLQHESWFIAEQDSPPVLHVVPAPYSVAPSDPCKSMATSHYCAKVRTSGAYAIFTETVSDCLCRYSSQIWDIWCCFSCCHGPISQVKYPDVAILGCWCDPRSARTLTVSCITGFLVPLQESGNRAPVNIIKSSHCILWFSDLATPIDDVPGSCVWSWHIVSGSRNNLTTEFN